MNLLIKNANIIDLSHNFYGDLYIEVVVAPHDKFKRENNDIHLTIPVDFVDACLGTTIVVPTIYGDETLEIPSGTQPNAILKMRNKGVKDVRSDRYGDQFVHVDIKIPTKLSKEQKTYLMQYRNCEKPNETIYDKFKKAFKK